MASCWDILHLYCTCCELDFCFAYHVFSFLFSGEKLDTDFPVKHLTGGFKILYDVIIRSSFLLSHDLSIGGGDRGLLRLPYLFYNATARIYNIQYLIWVESKVNSIPVTINRVPHLYTVNHSQFRDVMGNCVQLFWQQHEEVICYTASGTRGKALHSVCLVASEFEDDSGAALRYVIKILCTWLMI